MIKMNDKIGKRTAMILKILFAAAACFCVAAVIMTFMGRVRIQVQDENGQSYDAILSEPAKEVSKNYFLVDSEYLRNQTVQVPGSGEIGTAAYIGIVSETVLLILPYILITVMLSKVFASIQRGAVFEKSNIDRLFVSGIVILPLGILLPILIGLVIPAIVNHLYAARLIISMPLFIGHLLIYGAIFLIAAYVFSCGHTLRSQLTRQVK